MTVAFVLDRRSDTPLNRQIYDAWRMGILHGRFRAGERVPSARALAATYRVARVTVSAAYDQLLAKATLRRSTAPERSSRPELPDRMLHPVRTGRCR
jgi:GntR family transcriptional regulator/MocR family aminotransferase